MRHLPRTKQTTGVPRFRLVPSKRGWDRVHVAIEWLRSPLTCKMGHHIPDIEEATVHKTRNIAWAPCKLCGLLVEVPLDDLPDRKWIEAAVNALVNGRPVDDDE